VTNPTEADIERVARAICDETSSKHDPSCVERGALCRHGAMPAKCDAFRIARAAIAAMQREASEPTITPEMVEAGAKKMHPELFTGFAEDRHRAAWPTKLEALQGVVRGEVRRIYLAMRAKEPR
jgi:hypothetical protein